MPRNVSELKSGGGQFLCCPPRPEKWGGGRVPPSPTDRRPCIYIYIYIYIYIVYIYIYSVYILCIYIYIVYM